MSRRALVLAVLLLAACGDRVVEVQFHTPEQCPGAQPAECPMEGLGSLLVQVERTSGEIERERCLPPPEGLCDYEGLEGVPLLDGIAPLSGVEVRVEGFTNDVCLGAADVFCCDSVEDHIVDLASEAFPVDIWCSCVPRAVPCSR